MTAFLHAAEQIFDELRRKHSEATSALTKQQLVETIRQALECGDFIRYVCVTDNAQQVVYIPFAREAELRSRIQQLEKRLEQLDDKNECDT